MEDHKQLSSAINCCPVLNRIKRTVMEIELDSHLSSSREEKVTKHRNGMVASKKMKRQRLINKSGRIRMNYVNVPDRGQLYYLNDHFTTLIEAQWRYVFLVFSFAFLVSWLVFGSIWWVIHSIRIKQGITCIEKVSSWTSAFLFSLETQTTIGYGGRQITPDCPEGVICLLFQCIIGSLISSTMLGMIFAKVARPHKRTNTIIFSRHAVIGPRDGKLYLMFRIADVRKRQLIESHINVFLIRRHVTKEGEEIGCFRQPLAVTFDGDDDGEKIFLFAPVIVQHEIDENSPFYEYSPDGLNITDFEIIVFLEGIVEATGMTAQARTSYVSDEIHWGHLFVDMVRNAESQSLYLDVDISQLHNSYAVDNFPRVSAREFYESMGDGPGEQESSQEEALSLHEQTGCALTEVPVRTGVALIPNGEVGKDAISQL